MTSTVWGIDVAVSHLEFAFADLDSDHVDVESLITRSDTREGERLGLIDRQVRIYARQAAGAHPPHVVFVEQPSGRWRNLQLCYAAGVVQAALFEALGCPVWTIPSKKWKVATVGTGNATKPQIAAWVESQRIEFDGQDQADAIAIAVAGRMIVRTGQWDATERMAA